jgi:Zn ribbon nucleic-acid-binding protein
MLEAKCPHCLNRAEVDDDLSFVECKNCDYHDTYENYIESMRDKAENMANDFQSNWYQRN